MRRSDDRRYQRSDYRDRRNDYRERDVDEFGRTRKRRSISPTHRNDSRERYRRDSPPRYREDSRERHRNSNRYRDDSRERYRSDSVRNHRDSRPEPDRDSRRNDRESRRDSGDTMKEDKDKETVRSQEAHGTSMEPEEPAAEIDEEEQMRIMMGFGGFDSTKGKHIPDADVSAVDAPKKVRQFRQYYNLKPDESKE